VLPLFDGAGPYCLQLVVYRQSTIGQHPVVVLNSPDENGLVMVASMSHRHPGNPPQQPTSMYNLPTQMHPIEGEGTISVGWPNIVHFSKLKRTQMSAIMNAYDLEALMTEIGKFLLIALLDRQTHKRAESHCLGLVFAR